MRILVVSDIHGNRAALEAVSTAEPYDAVICLGDIVGYGPEPSWCMRWVRDCRAWVVQGNHDRAIADDIAPRCRPDFAWLAEAVTPLTRSQLTPNETQFLHRLPRDVHVELDGVRLACFHAKPSDPLYGYMPPNASAWAPELRNVAADLVLVGHTHIPLDLTIDGRRLFNPGSVGQPKDGDSRAAFAMIVDGRPSLRRVEYAIDETVAALDNSSIDRRAVTVLSDMLRNGRAPTESRIAP